MNRSKLTAVMAVAVFLGCVTLYSAPGVPAQQAGAQRHILERHDLSGIQGREGVLVQTEFSPGAREPKHTHPGDIFGYVQEGSLALTVEGSPATTLKPGEVFFVPAGKVHWGENAAQGNTKLLVTFVIEKGKPLTTPVQ